jgi:hypothetical protein
MLYSATIKQTIQIPIERVELMMVMTNTNYNEDNLRVILFFIPGIDKGDVNDALIVVMAENA